MDTVTSDGQCSTIEKNESTYTHQENHVLSCKSDEHRAETEKTDEKANNENDDKIGNDACSKSVTIKVTEQEIAKVASTNNGHNATIKGHRMGRRKKDKTLSDNDAAKAKTPVRSKSAPAPRKKKEKPNHLVTDYFPVRRSSRMCKTDVKKQQQTELENAILMKKEDGLKVVDFGEKGRGVIATKSFSRGDFVVEYAGELIYMPLANAREAMYSDTGEGCYMYYFIYKNQKYCVDATKESGRLGRLLNHSKTKANCMTRVVGIGTRPYLILVAARDINPDEELLYDYGDRSKSSLESHPWLSK